MTDNKKIYAALLTAQKIFAAVGKDSRNTQQNYQYRGVDDFTNKAHSALCSAGIVAAPEVLEIGNQERATAKGGLLIYTTVKIRYTLYAEDGSSVQVVSAGMGMDSGDKSLNKALAAAYKYMLAQTFSVPTCGVFVDSEKDSPEPAPRQVYQQQQPTYQQQQQQYQPHGYPGGGQYGR